MSDADKTQSELDAEAVRSMFDNGMQPDSDPAKEASDKKANVLAKVREIMERASRPDTPPGEVEACHRQADKLMTKFALEAWMIPDSDTQQTQMPDVRWMDYEWWKKNQFREQLQWMFGSVAKHCRCQTVPSKLKSEAVGPGTYAYRMPVVGLPSDLDWFDLLFTNIMIFMIERVDPQANAGISVNENMARMREAGLPWGEALNRLVRGGVLPSLSREAFGGYGDEPAWDAEYRMDGRGKERLYFSKEIYMKSITDYRNWCAQTGREQSKVSQVTFRRHFANGFAAEVTERLGRMNRDTESSYDSEHEAGAMDLAVRDISKIVQETVYNLFPDLRPHPAGCDCDDCHWCYDAYCNRARCVARRDWKPMRTGHYARAPKEEKVDYAAQQAGREAGREVSLSNSPSDRIGGQKGLSN